MVGVVEEREEIFPYSNVKMESSLAVHILFGVLHPLSEHVTVVHPRKD